MLKLKNLFYSFLSLLFVAGILLFPNECISSAKDGLNMSLYLILPSLFPFAVISSYISSKLILPKSISKPISKLLNLSENAILPFVLGLISGYPIGAVLTSSAVKNNRISTSEGEHLLPFCNACGPLFLIGVAGGGMMGGYSYGYFLLLVQTLSIFLTVLIFRKSAPYIIKAEHNDTKNSNYGFVSAMDSSISSILKVFGAVIFFSVVCTQIKLTKVFENLLPIPALGYGLVEVTNGLNRLALSEIPVRLKLSVCSALCGFSGICIYIQVQSAVKETKIKLKKYLAYKSVIAVISFFLSFILFPLFPHLTPTFHTPTPPLSLPFEVGSYLFILLFLIAWNTFKKFKVSFFDKR